MIKKIIIIFLLFVTFSGGTALANLRVEQAQKQVGTTTKTLDAAKTTLDAAKTTLDAAKTKENVEKVTKAEDELKNAENALKNANEALESAQKRAKECASGDCIDQESFMIDTSLFSPGGKGLKQENSQATINYTLGSIIQKLMIALGVISLLIMTIGAGYIILYHGEDEYLTKGKGIFTAGIISLVIALSSYYIVNLVAYILYQ